MAIAALLVAGILLFCEPLAVFLGARDSSAHLLPLVKDYLLGLVFSFPAYILLFEFDTLMRLDGDSKRVIVAVLTMTTLDIAGDLLNALVIHGGMLGMGLATTISYLAALVIMLLHFKKDDIIFRFSLKGLQPSDLGDILTTGLPSATGSASSMMRNFVLNNLMVVSVLSGTAVGALGVVNTVMGLTTCILIGVGMTSSMIAGMILDEQDRASAEQLVRITFRTALILGAAPAVAVFALAGVIAAMFGSTDGAEMVHLATRGLRIYAFSIVLYGINNSFVNYIQGMRRSALSTTYITISKPEEVIPASTLTDEFCTSKNADASTRLRLSLFVEELGNNVAEYGFVEGERNILEIRVVHLDEGWILRLRDNCKAFDPVKWVQLNQSDDPAANIGIKMVCRMAKQVTYVSTLDLNVLTLRI